MRYERIPMKSRDRTRDGAPRDKSRTARAKSETMTRKRQRALKREG